MYVQMKFRFHFLLPALSDAFLKILFQQNSSSVYEWNSLAEQQLL